MEIIGLNSMMFSMAEIRRPSCVYSCSRVQHPAFGNCDSSHVRSSADDWRGKASADGRKLMPKRLAMNASFCSQGRISR